MKIWITIAYANLFSIFLNCFVMVYENEIILPCFIAILGNGLAILVCLSAIQRKTEK